MRRCLDLFAQLRDEIRLLDALDVLQLDLFILEPLGGIDEHAQSQRGPDRRIEGTKFKFFFALGPVTVRNRRVLGTEVYGW